MFVCDNGHEDIVYNSGGCPLCNTLEELTEAKADLEDAQNELEEVKEELEELEEEYSSMAEKARATAPELLI